MITFAAIGPYYQQTIESTLVKKSTEIITGVAFHIFHILKYTAIVPAAITSIVIGSPLALCSIVLFAITWGMDIVAQKICNIQTVDQIPTNTVERIAITIHYFAIYRIPKITLFIVMTALSPYIVATMSIDYVEDITITITQIVLDKLGIPVQLTISRKKLTSVLNEWKSRGLATEDREKACEKIMNCYDQSNDLLNNILFSRDYLYIEDCGLRDLPEIFSYKPFSKISTLFLNNNQLTFLPDSIFALPSTCSVYIRQNQFAEVEVYRILTTTNGPNYQGPIISGITIYDAPEFFTADRAVRVNFNENAINTRSHSIDYFYRTFCQSVDHDPQDLDNLEQSETLRSWLSRLSQVSDFRRSNQDTRTAFIRNIIKYLEEANDNIEFRNIFVNIIQGASETCGDRVALSVLHLDIAYQLANIDITNMRQLAHFLLRGCLSMELLQECARQKVQSMRGEVDELEVYLGYPIHLKRDLELPISQETMLYFQCSLLTSEDLETAKNFVMSHLNNQDACLTFLINHESWKRALANYNPAAFDAIEDKKLRDLENTESPEEFIRINDEYNQALKSLSANILI